MTSTRCRRWRGSPALGSLRDRAQGRTRALPAFHGMPQVAPGADSTVRDVDDLAEPFALQQRCRETAALAPAAHCRDLAIPGKLVQTLDQMAVRDMDGARNVRL